MRKQLVGGSLEVGEIKVHYEHLGQKLTTFLFFFRPNKFDNVMMKIDEGGLYRPTTAETISLIDFAQKNCRDLYCKEILWRFGKYGLWTSTDSLIFPEGVIVYDNIDGKMPDTRDGLLRMMESGDERIRLVSMRGGEIPRGLMEMGEFLNNPYVHAQIGEDTMPILERVAKRFHETAAEVHFFDSSDSDRLVHTNLGLCAIDKFCLRGGSHPAQKSYAYGIKKD